MDPRPRVLTVPPASIGVLMLETRFTRPVGDLGNPATFDFPISYEVVPGAGVGQVVQRRAEGLLGPFVSAGERLIGRGAVALTTSCGFMALLQRELATALPVPVATSSLLQVGWLATMLSPEHRCGVITADFAALGPDHLRACGAPEGTPVEGMPADGAFAYHILGDRPGIDTAAVRSELIEAGRALVRREPTLGAVVLECTNLAPYAGSLADELDLPAYDVCSLVRWLWRGAARARRAGTSAASPGNLA